MNNFILSLLIYFSYYAFIAIILTLLTHYTKIHKEIIRKTYHIFASSSIFILLYFFDNPIQSMLTITLSFLSFFLIILTTNKFKKLDKLRITRNTQKYDFEKQIFFVIFNFNLVIFIFWFLGGNNNKYHALLGIMIWGVGDAFAAIIGKLYGKIKFKNNIFDNKKTVEGTIAFYLSGLIISFIIIIFFGKIKLFPALLISSILSTIGFLIEAASKKGWDNFLLPISISTASYLLIFIYNNFFII